MPIAVSPSSVKTVNRSNSSSRMRRRTGCPWVVVLLAGLQWLFPFIQLLLCSLSNSSNQLFVLYSTRSTTLFNTFVVQKAASFEHKSTKVDLWTSTFFRSYEFLKTTMIKNPCKAALWTAVPTHAILFRGIDTTAGSDAADPPDSLGTSTAPRRPRSTAARSWPPPRRTPPPSTTRGGTACPAAPSTGKPETPGTPPCRPPTSPWKNPDKNLKIPAARPRSSNESAEKGLLSAAEAKQDKGSQLDGGGVGRT